MLARQADLALAELSEAENEPQLATRLVGSHPLTFLARPKHPLLAGKPLTIDRIFTYPLAGTRAPSPLKRHLPKDLHAAGWIDETNGDFASAIRIDSITADVQVAIDSDVIAVAP